MISRRKLYAAGLPFGDCATQAKPGGRLGELIFGGGGGGGSSSSESIQATTTNNTDRRMVTDGGSVGVGGDGNSLNLTRNLTDARNFTDASVKTTVDSTSIEAGRQIALSGIANNATNTDNLLSAATILFTQTQKSLDANTQLAGQLAAGANNAYSDATAQGTGNKQLIMVGMAVVGIAIVVTLGKK